VDTKGTVTTNKLQLVAGGSPASELVKLDYATEYQLAPQSGTLQQGDVHIGKALAQLTGTYKTAGETTSVDLKLKGSNMPVTDVSSLLPAVGVVLPKGAELRDGTLTMDMSITGPVDKLVTSGPVHLDNAKLSGFDLGSKMKVLSLFGGISGGSDTTIQTFSSNLRVANEGIRADNLDLVVPPIGSLTGNGTISSNQALDFKMVAKLGSSGSALGALSSGLGALTGGGQKNSGGIPFRIQGTTSNPTFLPDLGGFASGLGGTAASEGKAVAPSAGDLGRALGGLLGGKKSQ
jgi:AsmA protein